MLKPTRVEGLRAPIRMPNQTERNFIFPRKSIFAFVQQTSAVPRSSISPPNRSNQVVKNLIVQTVDCHKLVKKGVSCRCSVFNRVNSYCL